MGELIIERAIPDTALEPVGDGWTVSGRVVPYGVDQLVVDRGAESYFERFVDGVFAKDVAARGTWVNLILGHSGDDGAGYLGRCVGLREDPDGLYADFRLNREHPRAEEARAGELTGWSVGARVYKSRRLKEQGRVIVERTLCGLRHVAATARPQYAGAGVLAYREHELVDEVPKAPIRDALRAKHKLI
jgi:HK97 family phage prohead protease